jgi:hypothetical protein
MNNKKPDNIFSAYTDAFFPVLTEIFTIDNLWELIVFLFIVLFFLFLYYFPFWFPRVYAFALVIPSVIPPLIVTHILYPSYFSVFFSNLIAQLKCVGLLGWAHYVFLRSFVPVPLIIFFLYAMAVLISPFMYRGECYPPKVSYKFVFLFCVLLALAGYISYIEFVI